jgi:hypothetical protein
VLNIKEMKKLLGIAAIALLLMGCDDGDVSVETIDFNEVEASNCGNIIYKINEKETIFLELANDADFALAFQNEPTADGAPLVFPINESNRVFYRAYDGNVSANNFCNPIPPVTPIVVEEWTVSDGTIEIETDAVIVQNTNAGFPGGEKIQKYRHTITLRDITWQKPGGEQTEEVFDDFGSYDTFPNAQLFTFGFDDVLDKCPSANVIYNFLGREGITLFYEPGLIVNEVTPLGSPRVVNLNANNILTYKLYNSADSTLLTSENFCGSATVPATLETWTGVNGSDMTGRIEVTTTTNGPGSYLHQIHLINVSFKKGNTQFLLATDYLLGELITTD